MAQINNLPSLPTDITTDYFNNFLKPSINISQDVDEAILGFFESITQTKGAAKSLAGALIYTAKAQNLDPIAVLTQFAALPKGELNSYLVMFLNLNRIGTSLLGLTNAPKPSKYITRTLLV